MSKIETIKELNSKWWYRILKVIFIFLFLIVLAINYSFIAPTTPKKQINFEKSIVNCNYPDFKITAAKGDVSFRLSSLYTDEEKFQKEVDQTSEVGPIGNTQIWLHCYDVYQTIYPENIAPSKGWTPEEKAKVDKAMAELKQEQELDKMGVNVNINQTKIAPNFKISIVTYWEPTISSFIFKLLSSILIIIIIFATIQRIFYYIILGKLMPKK
jgi:hypothetical protein